MHISELFNRVKTSISFEFFPPKSEKASENLLAASKRLDVLRPTFVSVTYGAGGGTRDLTHKLVVDLQKSNNFPVVSHLTCVGHSKKEIEEILKKYDESGIQNIMALRGDPPKGETRFTQTEGGFLYASDLVEFIKEKFPHMGVGVAGFPEGHPECPNRLMEIDYLKRKVDAGADYICTQLFFDNRDFFDFCERCEIAGINVPIIAGIMPITSMKNMKRISELALGAKFPAKLMRALSRASDDDYAQKVGTHWAAEQCLELVDQKVKGIHFYTLNKSDATLKICQSLGIKNSEELQAL